VNEQTVTGRSPSPEGEGRDEGDLFLIFNAKYNSSEILKADSQLSPCHNEY
jgi:hypothetical protein